jgi:gliding motility-associated-like protein
VRVFRIIIFAALVLRSLLVFSQDPFAPIITHVSINPTVQQVEINWVNSTNSVVGYIIYFQDISGLWIPLDTVMGISNTSYITSNANPQQKIETFSVVAFDGLGNSSVRSDSHSTIFMNFNYENCDTSLALKWNSYLNLYAMDGYQLIINSEDLLTGMPLPEQTIDIDANDTTFTLSIDYTTKYTLWIQAISPLNYTSLSNRLEIITTDIDLPTYSYINRVSVVGENSIEVSVLSDSEDISHVNVYKSSSENGFQFFIGQANPINDEFVVVDPIVLPERNIYYYRSKPVDICGKEYDLPKFSTLVDTSIAYNLKLKPLSVTEKTISVESKDYDSFLSDSKIELWKEVNGERTYLQDAYPYNNYDISIVNDVGKVCLYLISAEKTNNVLNRKDTVFSNKVCISKAPLLYAPNAFTPRNQDLKNNTWRILVNGESAIQKFSLKVYTRWGESIFETDSMDDEWDGTIRNTDAPQGVYFYNLQIDYAQGQRLQESGRILLLR